MTVASKTNLSFRDSLETLFRRRKIVLYTVPAILLAVLAVVLVTSRLYQSEMKILVQNSRGNIVISAEKTTTSVVNDVTEQQINSELEILHSRDVLDVAADPGWNAKPLAERTEKEVRAHNLLVTQMEARLGTDTGRKSNVITVTYEGATPRASQQVLERLSAAYLAEERRVQRPMGASDFFVGEAERYRQRWNDATQRFVDFQQQHQLVSLPDQEVSDDKDIALLQGQLRTMDTGLRELDGRLAESQARLRDTSERQVTEQKTLPNQESVQQLNTLAVQLENKRTTLLTQFKPDDRLVKEVEQQILQTRQALAQANGSTAQEQTTDVNPAWQQLRTRSLQDQVSRQALVQQRAAVAQQLATLEGQLAKTQSLTGQFNLLKSQADELKEDYQLYSQKRDEAQIEDAMDAQQLLNVTVAERPTLSYVPVRPKPLRTFALGLITALFLSFGLLYLVELGRTTIVTPRELELASDYPVLATVPLAAPSSPGERGRHHHSIKSGDALRQLLFAGELATGELASRNGGTRS